MINKLLAKTKLLKLILMRMVATGLALTISIVVVRELPLEQVGLYYLYVTLSYLANALIFVGADYHLQRVLHDLSEKKSINLPELFKYFSLILIPGFLLVLAFGTAYMYATSGTGLIVGIACASLASMTFLSALMRNLLQLSGMATKSALVNLFEQLMRLSITIAVVKAGFHNGESIIAANAIGALLAATMGIGLIYRYMTRDNRIYFFGYKKLIKSIIPIGSSGLMNWMQLQGYRPYVNYAFQRPDLIGAVSFLSSLGSTAANACLAILGQIWIPKQYASRGAATSRYFKIAVASIIGLALASLPAGWVFLHFTNHLDLMPYVFLVPVGVLVEGGNTLIGIHTNHRNATGQPLWIIPIATLGGIIITALILICPVPAASLPVLIAAALISGQLTILSIIASHNIFIKRRLCVK